MTAQLSDARQDEIWIVVAAVGEDVSESRRLHVLIPDSDGVGAQVRSPAIPPCFFTSEAPTILFLET
jgi:hypothetical protein